MYKYTQFNVYLYIAMGFVLNANSALFEDATAPEQVKHSYEATASRGNPRSAHQTSVTNQDDLRRKLAGRGFHVTQATLSRDIHELRLSKGPAGYALPGGNDVDEDTLPGIREVLEGFGLEVRQALNLLVFITRTGGAQTRRRRYRL